jgi:hypothetical protein
VVGQADSELCVGVRLVLGVRVRQYVDDVAQGFDQRAGLRLRELPSGHDPSELSLSGLALSFDFRDPLRDRGDRLTFIDVSEPALRYIYGAEEPNAYRRRNPS